MVAIGIAAAADQDPVPLFTSQDLDRMFGPAPPKPSDPVDKTRPEDWRWIEQFLDRQYSRIDADRQFDLSSRSVDIAARRVEQTSPIYGRSVAWGLGYPASMWWDVVGRHYAASSYDGYRGSYRAYRDPDAWATGGGVRSGGRDNMPRGGHARQHGRCSK